MKIEAGKTSYIDSKKYWIELPIPEKKVEPGETATHEAIHVVAALENGTGVESATIISGDGYLGLTKLTKPDAVAAMAPHAMGSSGTSYDVYIANIMGNSRSAESTARQIINSNMDKVMAVARGLEDNKTLNMGEINNIIDEIKNPKPIIARLFVEDLNREVTIRSIEIRANSAMTAGNWVDLPKAA